MGSDHLISASPPVTRSARPVSVSKWWGRARWRGRLAAEPSLPHKRPAPAP